MHEAAPLFLTPRLRLTFSSAPPARTLPPLIPFYFLQSRLPQSQLSAATATLPRAPRLLLPVTLEDKHQRLSAPDRFNQNLSHSPVRITLKLVARARYCIDIDRASSRVNKLNVTIDSNVRAEENQSCSKSCSDTPGLAPRCLSFLFRLRVLLGRPVFQLPSHLLPIPAALHVGWKGLSSRSTIPRIFAK